MPNFLLTIILIFSFAVSVAQSITRYTYHDGDKNQLKEIFQVRDTISNILHGSYLSYHLNGKLESKGQFSDNETSGVWEFYYETGKLKMRGELIDNLNHGKWEYFFESGEKSMEGEIRERRREDLWKFYYENGTLKSEGAFQKNKRLGPWKYYYEDGNLKGTITYQGNQGTYVEYYSSGEKRGEGPKVGTKNDGKWKYYYKLGETLQAEGYYSGGNKTGVWRYYHINGQIATVGRYEKDKQQGGWTYYHYDGSVRAKGEYIDGTKEGYWNLLYPDGTLKGEVNYEEGTGQYKEYYPTGELKVTGRIVHEQNQGEWKYYYKDGTPEGECNFVDSRGLYVGYHANGKVKTKGVIEDNNKKVGKWELYKEDGSLAGYYRPFYQSKISDKDLAKIKRPKKPQGIADYVYKRRRFTYFEPGINEFHGLIVGANPLATFFGKLPAALEFYYQERLGYEFEFEAIRDPFYRSGSKVALNDLYKRGYAVAVKQKFYQPDGSWGMWYFGHELRFANLDHFANINSDANPEDRIVVSAQEQKIEYVLLLGYRIMAVTNEPGFTLDIFGGVGTGYRSFTQDKAYEDVFDALPQNNIPLTLRLGINFSYTFSFGKKRGRR